MRTKNRRVIQDLAKMETHRKIIFTIFATVGIVAVWRGIWELFDVLPYFDRPIVSVLFALIIIVVGVAYFKYTEF